jgi:thioredoxin-like negative regulator of GroEL
MSLEKWTRQDWTTKSGKPSLQTGERYLPRKAIRKLTNEQYQRTTRAKRAGMRKGKQFVRQPKDVSKITKRYRQRNPSDERFHTKAIHMNDNNKKELMEKYSEDTILVWFYAPWCGHCQVFAPIYDEIYEEMSTMGDYAIMCVNIDSSPNMVGEYHIEGVPTIYKIKDGKKHMYNGDRSKKDIMQFLQEN